MAKNFWSCFSSFWFNEYIYSRTILIIQFLKADKVNTKNGIAHTKYQHKTFTKATSKTPQKCS